MSRDQESLVHIGRYLQIVKLTPPIERLEEDMSLFSGASALTESKEEQEFHALILFFNLINFGLFVYYCFYFYFEIAPTNRKMILVGLIGAACFLVATIFYLITACRDPGFVKKSSTLL